MSRLDIYDNIEDFLKDFDTDWYNLKIKEFNNSVEKNDNSGCILREELITLVEDANGVTHPVFETKQISFLQFLYDSNCYLEKAEIVNHKYTKSFNTLIIAFKIHIENIVKKNGILKLDSTLYKNLYLVKQKHLRVFIGNTKENIYKLFDIVIDQALKLSHLKLYQEVGFLFENKLDEICQYLCEFYLINNNSLKNVYINNKPNSSISAVSFLKKILQGAKISSSDIFFNFECKLAPQELYTLIFFLLDKVSVKEINTFLPFFKLSNKEIKVSAYYKAICKLRKPITDVYVPKLTFDLFQLP